MHFMRIESLKVANALLQPFDATPLLFYGEDRCFGLAGLGGPGALEGTTGHWLHSVVRDKHIIISGIRVVAHTVAAAAEGGSNEHP